MANNLKGELNRLSPVRKSALAICIFMFGWFLMTFPLIGIDYGNIIGTVLFAALICYIIKMPEVNSGIKSFGIPNAEESFYVSRRLRRCADLCLSELLRQK